MRVRRLPKRGAYDEATIAEILDAGFVCSVGIVRDGAPMVIPMLYWREDDRIYLHGSRDSALLAALCESQACVTVTHLDGIVLARSAFHHSVNYRSVAIVGRPELVTDVSEKERALRAFVDRMVPDRWAALRPVTQKELGLTKLVAMTLTQASAKIRSGPPIDDPGDVTWPCWAGVVPVTLVAGTPLPEPGAETLEPPSLLV
jgi:nitroimidazol reductase NimA-like FMN-containing flavoprotein (pyridoxamine 5'-phosphate oxidase superfamily)